MRRWTCESHRHLQQHEVLVEIDEEIDLDAGFTLVEADDPCHAGVPKAGIEADAPAVRTAFFDLPGAMDQPRFDGFRPAIGVKSPGVRAVVPEMQSDSPTAEEVHAAQRDLGDATAAKRNCNATIRQLFARSDDRVFPTPNFLHSVAAHLKLDTRSTVDFHREQDSWDQLIRFRLDLLK